MSRTLIREGNIEEVAALGAMIPEFIRPFSADDYKGRLEGQTHLILVAEIDLRPVGFKVGYARFQPGTFYSWMGGVLPVYRRMGIADSLAEAQEAWARDRGFRKVVFKTRNRFSGMIQFGPSRGFAIVGVFRKGDVLDYRILMEKEL